MQIENDYDKEVYNGDLGRVVSVDVEAGALVVDFDGREVAYDAGELDRLVLAYATTIHKAQGSEYPAVVMPLTTQHYPMLQRQLIYTGDHPRAPARRGGRAEEGAGDRGRAGHRAAPLVEARGVARVDAGVQGAAIASRDTRYDGQREPTHLAGRIDGPSRHVRPRAGVLDSPSYKVMRGGR